MAGRAADVRAELRQAAKDKVELTRLRETLEEVGGRNAREIIVSGLIVGEESIEDINSALDSILDEASFSNPMARYASAWASPAARPRT